jgi:hypothetical protein
MSDRPDLGRFVVGVDRVTDGLSEGLPVKSVVFELHSLDEIVQAGGRGFWVLEHLAPLIQAGGPQVLEDFYLDEEAGGVRVVLSEPMPIPEKVRRAFGVEVEDMRVVHEREVAKEEFERMYLRIPVAERDRIIDYIAEQLANGRSGVVGG